jgi:uncharacterized protein (TIGR03435 family)
MRKRTGSSRKRLLLAMAAVTLVLLLVGALVASRLQAQASSGQSPTPQWQIDAGGKMEFAVASVKENASPLSESHSNFALDSNLVEFPVSTGGFLSATNFPLIQYVTFAFRLDASQTKTVQSQLPKWANTKRYDIEARAPGNPTKDQFRMMMQSLLANRFELTSHYEKRRLPVFELVLDKPGRLGPQLRLHPSDTGCSDRSAGIPGGGAIAGEFPETCGGLFAGPSKSAPGRIRAGARNVTMDVIIGVLGFSWMGGVDRPVLDKTGLAGKVDFTIEFTPDVPAGISFQADPNGPTFMEALREQLGLKLESTTDLVDVLMIDHIEEPSPN